MPVTVVKKPTDMPEETKTRRNDTRPGVCRPKGIYYAQVFVQSYSKRADTKMREASPLVRQWILLRILCARRCGATVKELAAELEVGEKMVRRDLDAFRTAGFPLVETVGQFGRKSYRIEADKTQPGIAFAYDEAVALYLGRRFLEPLAGTVFWDAAQRAFKKIRSMLGKEARDTSNNSPPRSIRQASVRATTPKRLI